MTMKKCKWIIISMVLLILLSTVAFIGATFQRQYQDIFAELIIFTGTHRGNNTQVYRFVLRDNGILVSYRGISPNHYDVTSGRIIRWVQERSVIALSEEDFKSISEQVRFSVESDWTFRSEWLPILLYDGHDYWGVGSDLINEFIRLSPLEIR